MQKQQLGATLATHLIASQLRDRGIEISGSDVRANLIEHGKLAFKRGKNSRHAGVARSGRREIFHSQIPSKREPFPARPHILCVPAETERISR